MIFYYIDSVDRSSDVSEGTLSANSQLQQRSDQAQFELRNTEPTANQMVNIYIGDKIASAAGATLTLKGYFERNTSIFYPGQILRLRPQTATEEKVTVLSYDEDTLQLVLEEAPATAPVANDQIGQMVFAGFIAKIQDKNLQTLDNLLWDVTAVNFSKLFDAKVVTDSWENVDARYIINDFVNTYVNFNATLDQLTYASNAAVTAKWNKRYGDANAPTADSSNFIEGDGSVQFGWTHTGGLAAWSATIVAVNASEVVGATSGAVMGGSLMVWPDFSDVTAVSSFKIRIGSSVSDYLEVPFTLQTGSGNFYYLSEKLSSLTPVGTPNWTALTYLELRINESATGYVNLNGIRINSDSSFTLRQVQQTTEITGYRASQVKAAELINRLAKGFDYAWYVDYDLDVFFAPMETLPAPFQITDDTDNFTDLRVSTDTSNIGNRIIVNGGLAPSQSYYAQVFPTNGAIREWVLQAPPSGFSLTVLINDGSGTKTCGVGTTTTNVNITAHGFVAGDHIVNTSRGSVVREVLTVVDADNFTVLSVPSQTNGDTISYFNVSKTAGIEGLADEASVDYVYSSDKQSVRASLQTNTLPTGQFIRFRYKQLSPIILQYSDGVSVSALKALGLGNGVFDLDPISDTTITDNATALLAAQAQVVQYSNAVVTGTFRTTQKGLRAGQLLVINQETQRHFNNTYLIQKVTYRQKGGQYQDYVEYTVNFGTTLFGFVELMQKALRRQNTFGGDTSNTPIILIASGDEQVTAEDVNTVSLGGYNTVSNTETPAASDTNATYLTEGWQWEPSIGQAIPTRWNLFEWS